MNGSVRVMVSACLLCGLLAAGPAEADGGRITFSGAVVVPTCNTTAEVIASTRVPARLQRRYRQNCAGHGPVESSVSAYIVTARRLTHAEPDRVLNYFDGYVSASRADAAPMLITRTYE
ncbi:hypothetical protein [Rhodanobacter glycinis]|uniref:Type 1 fimbrial protein n=1 Tax=Rhodanobacter glycinis TaxID=582702 RepID=A0A1I3Z2P3_9GAMM|nr:hypothetical protein [Rhodanobacter glycinis]SFK37786.1 hypothetical protein SAMN05192579_102141 [Rhodanobacter glycinis]